MKLYMEPAFAALPMAPTGRGHPLNGTHGLIGVPGFEFWRQFSLYEPRLKKRGRRWHIQLCRMQLHHSSSVDSSFTLRDLDDRRSSVIAVRTSSCEAKSP